VWLAALWAPVSAHAVIGTLDVTPAATLLVPYFEVDLDAAGGTDARITVLSSSPTAVLAHVVVWSDAAVPVLNFNIYLTGYDVQTFTMRDVLAGNLPATASAGQDPTDAISPKGVTSQDINFASCAGVLPPAPLTAAQLADLHAALTGAPIPGAGSRCAGLAHGDHVARGYVTIDVVTNCTNRMPHEPGYFGAGGSGDAAPWNLLVGDYALLDATGAVLAAEPAVHLEASATNPLTSTAGSYTFYGRLVGWSAADHREPLATQWTAPYEGEGARLIVWRDPKTVPATFACTTSPSWYPLGYEGIVGFDTQEHPTQVGVVAPSHIPGEPPPPSLLPAAVNVVAIGPGGFEGLAPRGFLSLDLNTVVAAAGASPPADPAAAQAYVLGIAHPEAVPGASPLTTTSSAVPLDSATYAIHALPFSPPPPPPWGPNITPKVGVSGPRPAATLLLPYFEVSLTDPNQANTTFTITNGQPTATLAHVVLWTDLGIPTWAGNIYLTGFDVATLDLRLLFMAGLNELSASDGQDFQDLVSPKGPFSQDINFASCNGLLPEARLTAAQRDHLRKAHTGQGSPLWAGRCSGAALGDDIARGFVTVDTVNACSMMTPAPGYFMPGGTGYATNQNYLTGTFTFFNRAAALAYAGPVVHVQAFPSDPATSTSGNYTFYGRHVGWNASDNREPLGTTWQTRYHNGATAAERTSLFVWQDPGVPVNPFTCGSAPGVFPLSAVSMVAFDEQEHPVALTGTLAPRVAARIDVGPAGLNVPFAAGFLALDFHGATGASPPADPTARQASVTAVHPAGGRATALGAFQIDNPANPAP
jgi:hypothetical protein